MSLPCATDHPGVFRTAFFTTTTARAALPVADLNPVNLDVSHVVVTVLGALPRIQALRAEMTAALHPNLVQHVDSLEPYALALDWAHIVHAAASAPDDHLPELAARARQQREQLLSDARALAHRGLVNSAPLQRLEGGRGYLNVARDLGVLVHLLREHWSVIAGKTPIELRELDEAESLFDQITLAVAARQRTPEQIAAAADDRQRAFTLLVNAYDQVRRIVAFLRHGKGDAEEIAPSLWAGRGRRKRRQPAAVRQEKTPQATAAPGPTPRLRVAVDAVPERPAPNDDVMPPRLAMPRPYDVEPLAPDRL